MTTLTNETTVLDLLIEARKYDADNIIVQDQAGFDALPVGTLLGDLKDDDLYSKGEDGDGLTRYGRSFSSVEDYLPALILNPEILGDFQEYTGPEPVVPTVQDSEALDALPSGSVLVDQSGEVVLVKCAGRWLHSGYSGRPYASDWTDSMHNWVTNCDQSFLVKHIPA